MYYYTISITPDGLLDVLDDATNRINAFSKRHRPFRIVVEQEQLDEKMSAQVCRFSLAVTPDFEVKNERAAWKFCEAMKAAAEEIEAMNGQNYIVVQPPRRGMGGGGPMG